SRSRVSQWIPLLREGRGPKLPRSSQQAPVPQLLLAGFPHFQGHPGQSEIRRSAVGEQFQPVQPLQSGGLTLKRRRPRVWFLLRPSRPSFHRRFRCVVLGSLGSAGGRFLPPAICHSATTRGQERGPIAGGSTPLSSSQSARWVGVRRLGIVATNARRTAFTDSALWNTRATSGSSRTATDPGRARPANRFGLAFA